MPFHNRCFLAIAVLAILFSSCKKSNTGGHKIGDHYQGGIIFYLDSVNNERGLVAAPADLGTYSWSLSARTNDSVPYAYASEMHAGGANTGYIIDYYGPGTYAASACRNLDLGGYKDWFLPCMAELAELYKQRTVVGGFTDGYYWSSTFAGKNEAVSFADDLNFSTGIPELNDQMLIASVNHVRAVRLFGQSE